MVNLAQSRQRLPHLSRCGAAVLAVVLAGCAPEPVTDVEIGFRNPTVTLSGSTRFDAAHFAGDWLSVACLGNCSKSITYLPATDGVLLRRTEAGGVAYRQSGPGILREVGGTNVLVVMWVDEGFRTAAVGDADGRWAAVIDRTGRGGADRVRAATEILDFNGWDVTRMRRIER